MSSTNRQSKESFAARRAVLIVNTHSRKASQLYDNVKQQLEAGGLNFLACYPVKDPKMLNETIGQALGHKPDILVIGSGDGTISEVVDHLAHTKTVLGFIPLGTTNNFARSVGIPLDLAGAIDTILHGRIKPVDLGKAGDDYFANVASIGISVELAATVPHGLKKYFGRFAYALTGLKVMARHRAFKATIETPERTYHVRTHQLVVANGRSHSGTVIARDARIDNQQLAIFRIGKPGRWQLLKAMARFSFDQHRSLKEKDYIRTNSATITTKPACDVELDGEIKATTPLTFGIAANALRIMVPKL